MCVADTFLCTLVFICITKESITEKRVSDSSALGLATARIHHSFLCHLVVPMSPSFIPLSPRGWSTVIYSALGFLWWLFRSFLWHGTKSPVRDRKPEQTTTVSQHMQKLSFQAYSGHTSTCWLCNGRESFPIINPAFPPPHKKGGSWWLGGWYKIVQLPISIAGAKAKKPDSVLYLV